MAHYTVLTWDAPITDDVVYYDIQRAPAPDGIVGAYTSIANVVAPITTYTDLSVIGGQEYSYEVSSVNLNGESVPCANVLATIPADGTFEIAFSLDGKPLNVLDQVSVSGDVISISGTGPGASISILLIDEKTTVVVPASTIYNTQSL